MSTWETYPSTPVRMSEDELRELAVELVTEVAQQAFRNLDEDRLVAESGLALTEQDRERVAALINAATVRLEVDFH